MRFLIRTLVLVLSVLFEADRDVASKKGNNVMVMYDN